MLSRVFPDAPPIQLCYRRVRVASACLLVHVCVRMCTDSRTPSFPFVVQAHGGYSRGSPEAETRWVSPHAVVEAQNYGGMYNYARMCVSHACVGSLACVCKYMYVRANIYIYIYIYVDPIP